MLYLKLRGIFKRFIMLNPAINSFIGQIEEYSFHDRLSIIQAVFKSFFSRKNKPATHKADSLYGIIKDSSYTLESAREERLSQI